MSGVQRIGCFFVLFLIAHHFSLSNGFYIPGVAPTEYNKDDKLEIRVRD